MLRKLNKVNGLVLSVVAFMVTASFGVGNIRAQSQLEPLTFKLGSEELVYDWTTDRCENFDISDTPFRVFRDKGDNIHMLSSHWHNRQNVGAELDTVIHGCNIILDSHLNQDFTLFDEHHWINAVYTEDGEKIYAILHHEHLGYKYVTDDDDSACPGYGKPGGPTTQECSYYSIGSASSVDMGSTYLHDIDTDVPPDTTPPNHLVAASPYPYIPGLGPFGMGGGTNIVKKDDYYYKIISIVNDYEAQQFGTTVMRTQDLSDPNSWRCWGGEAFDVRLIDPYREVPDGSDPANHVCAHVSRSNIQRLLSSLTYNTYLGKYILVGHQGVMFDKTGELIFGFFYSLSDDLVNWSPRQLLWETTTLQSPEPDPPAPPLPRHTDPSLIDPDDTSRNFEYSDNEFYMYYRIKHPRGNLDRDVRRRIVTIIDNTPPAIEISPPSKNEANNEDTISYTVTYTDMASFTANLTDADIELLTEEGSATGTVLPPEPEDIEGKIWTVKINNLQGNGILRFRIKRGTATDNPGNVSNEAFSMPFEVDNIPPTINISGPSESEANKEDTVEYTVTYGGADQVVLHRDHILLSASTDVNENKVIKSVTEENPETWTVALSNLLGDGSLEFRLSVGTAQDNAGNRTPRTEFDGTTLVTVDNTPPTVNISPPSVNETVTGPVSYMVSYSGADQVVLDPNHVLLKASGTVPDPSVDDIMVTDISNTTRMVTLNNLSGFGTVEIRLKIGTATDTAGNKTPPTFFDTSTLVIVNDTDTDEDGEPDLNDPDDDNDGFEDTYEEAHSECLNPLQADDPDVDGDGDGLTLLEEFTISEQLNPCDADTDGDKIDDLLDSDPLIGDNVCSGSDEAILTDAVNEGEEIQCGASISITVSPDVEELGLLRLISPKVIFNAGSVSGELVIDSSHPCQACGL